VIDPAVLVDLPAAARIPARRPARFDPYDFPKSGNARRVHAFGRHSKGATMKNANSKVLPYALACLVFAAGCMAGPSNGETLASFDAPIAMSGFTGQPAQIVSIDVYDWCTDTMTIGQGSTISSQDPTVFTGAAGDGDATGYFWSLERNFSACRHWSPYGCNFADWGTAQGRLRLKPMTMNRDGTDLAAAAVFADPAFGESNLVDCYGTVSRIAQDFGLALNPLQLAAVCADPDGFADMQIRDVTHTWSVDFSGTTVVDEQEGEDELYNPVIVGFRSALAPSASLGLTWINDLSERTIDQGQTYVLDDRTGRIHFRNVDTVTIAEFLGCDSATARINPAEFDELAAIGKIPLENLTPANVERAMTLLNRFRCTLNQTPKDITVVGWALTTIESDNTPISVVKDEINRKLNIKRTEMEPQLRSLGSQLAQVRTAMRDIVQFCNDTATPAGYTADCLLRFKDLNLNLESGARGIGSSGGSLIGTIASLGGLTHELVSFFRSLQDAIIDCLIAQCDQDDPIGDTVVRTYLAVDPGFWSLLSSRVPSGTLPAGTQRLANESYNISTIGDGAHYQTAGRTADFTQELQTSRLASERARNANRCPWTPPAESSSTGVTL
jgi:hypothetical protein